MAAKEYRFHGSTLTGKFYISKMSKKNRNTFTDDKVEVPMGDFVNALAAHWSAKGGEDDTDKIVSITCDGKVIFEIKGFPENF